MKKIMLLLVILAFLQNTAFAQEEVRLTAKDSVAESYWLVGLGWNVVDDAGLLFNQAFNANTNWNYVVFPSRLSVGRYFDNGFGLELIGSYNKYKEGNLVDGQILTDDIDYFSVDLRASYDLNYLFGETGFFDPYVGVGLGYADANNLGRTNFLSTIGFRLWFNEDLGLDINTNGHFALKEEASNHYQHALGLVYRFGSEKKLSAKGEEKLLIITQMEEAEKRRLDSIAAVRAEEARLAEQIRIKEAEAQRIKAAALALEEEERKKWDDLNRRVEELGHVYFDFNSSFLTAKSKEILDQVVALLKEENTRVIKVVTHADSRGDKTYNQWLSERRLQRVVDYLIAAEIDPNQLRKSALGEEILNNECKDNVPCPENKHQENRRAEFNLIRL
ncbi:OmpA family protein [Aureicoccus marinus]|uniref:OmpA-like domain-containing protein n=1 Tax=Aureicoccus marinus TaxID=754435 RepID=A0A2S7T5Q7_9FLAO|nr:OmpA family protein [Aureicoccus marinus]PQJ15253.1 hypothetical protein BST99_05485 [Aureicoccus marinus]